MVVAACPTVPDTVVLVAVSGVVFMPSANVTFVVAAVEAK